MPCDTCPQNIHLLKNGEALALIITSWDRDTMVLKKVINLKNQGYIHNKSDILFRRVPLVFVNLLCYTSHSKSSLQILADRGLVTPVHVSTPNLIDSCQFVGGSQSGTASLMLRCLVKPSQVILRYVEHL